MVLTALAFCFQSSLISDPRLASDVSFDKSLTQITEFCTEASQVSGLELSVAKEVRDLKVDVFVEKKPMREILDKVAKVLNCTWTPTEKGYALTMEVPVQNRERNFNKAEFDYALRALELQLWGKEYVAGKMPGSAQPRRWQQDDAFAFQQKIVSPFQQEYSAAAQSGDQAKTKLTLDKLTAVNEALQSFIVGRVLSQFDNPTRKQFWNGEPFIASTFPESPYKLFISDLTRMGVNSYGLKDGRSVEADYQACLIMKFDPVQGRLKVNQLTFAKAPEEYGGNVSTSQSSAGSEFSSTSNPVAEELKKLPFYQDLATWSESEKTALEFADRKFVKTEEWPSSWIGSRRRLGDHLKWFHRATGIPIVAQADRSCVYSWVKLDRGFETVPKYLTDLVTRFDTYCKKDGEFLMARNFRFWSHQLHEATEEVWQKVEPKDATFKLSLEDYARIPQLLREDQIMNRDIEYPLCRLDLTPLKRAYHSLRLYGLLSPAQQAIARQKGGISLSNLNSSQREQLTTTFMNLVVDKGMCSYELARVLVKKNLSPESLQSIRFSVQASAPIENNDHVDEVLDGEQIVYQKRIDTYKVSQVHFNFALSDKESVSQFVDIKQ